MYLWSQTQDMPLTPGLQWTKSGTTFRKSVMMSGVSLGQLQWINYVQESDLVLDDNGSRVQIEHAYFRGEKSLGGFRFDGYFEKNDQKYFMEYNGELKLQI